jgi:hypothetical protein
MQLEVDLAAELTTRAAILDRLSGVPCVEVRRIAEHVEQHLGMGPADLCSQWLHYLLVGP